MTLDMNSPVIPTHGAQEGTRFWKRRAISMRSVFEPIVFFKAGLRICSNALWADHRTMCDATMATSNIRAPWDKPRRAVAKVEWHPSELFPRVDSAAKAKNLAQVGHQVPKPRDIFQKGLLSAHSSGKKIKRHF